MLSRADISPCPNQYAVGNRFVPIPRRIVVCGLLMAIAHEVAAAVVEHRDTREKVKITERWALCLVVRTRAIFSQITVVEPRNLGWGVVWIRKIATLTGILGYDIQQQLPKHELDDPGIKRHVSEYIHS